MKSTTWLQKKEIPVLIGLALLVGLVLSFGTAWCTGDWGGLLLNLGTEIIGALATYGLFVKFIGRRETKAALIEQMGSTVKDVAIPAVEELRRRGWLFDGSLTGADLSAANLQGAALSSANLQGAILSGANLQRAYLIKTNLQGTILYWTKLQKAALPGANLQGANLGWANLQGADLHEANLQGASLSYANLQGAILLGVKLQDADLMEANLQGVDLTKADLQGTYLGMAEFSKDTTLPDSTKWTPDTDMARFTDPTHPDFWQPDAS